MLRTKALVIEQKALPVGSDNPAQSGYEQSCETLAPTVGQGPCPHFQLMFEELWPLEALGGPVELASPLRLKRALRGFAPYASPSCGVGFY